MKKRNIIYVLLTCLCIIFAFTVFIMTNTVLSYGQREKVLESSIDLSTDALLSRGCRESGAEDGYKYYTVSDGGDASGEWVASVCVDDSLSDSECKQLKADRIRGAREWTSRGCYKTVIIEGENENFKIYIYIIKTEWKNDDVYSVVSQILGS